MRVARFRILFIFSILLLASSVFYFLFDPHPPKISYYDSGEWGSYELWTPEHQPESLVFFFSDHEGFRPEEKKAARQLVNLGAAVALVNTDIYLSRIDQPSDPEEEGLYLPGAVEWTSHFLQEELHFPEYKKPYLLGRGVGAGIVQALLVQGGSNSFEGGLSIDFSPELPLKNPLSDHPPVSKKTSGQILDPKSKLCGWWHIDATSHPNQDTISFIHTSSVVNQGTSSEITVSKSIIKLVSDTFKPALEHKKEIQTSPISASVVEVAPHSTQKILAIVFSGDGGWRDIDKVIAHYLSEKDIAVIGINCLSYFWKKRNPQEVGQDLGWLLDCYLKKWGMDRVLLIGFSFGADILPPAYNRLPQDLQKKVMQITLLSPSKSTEYEFHISGWFSSGVSPTAQPLPPEIEKIKKDKIQCFYGEEDDETLCSLPCTKGLEIIKTTGGHHFDGEYEKIGDRILSGLFQRLRIKNNDVKTQLTASKAK